MELIKHFYQVRDTTVKSLQLKTGGIHNALKVERKSIEISDIRTFQVDSSRMVKPKKKVLPIIKTVPYVPQQDSIEHPVYNVFENNFEFPEKEQLFDQLQINPINPKLGLNSTATNKTPINKLGAKSKIIEIPAKDTFRKLEKETGEPGFETTDWMLGVIIFLWLIFGWLRVGFVRFFQTAIQASYNYFAARRIHEEANVVRSRVFYFMNTLFFLNLALFITQMFDYYNYNILNLDFYLIFLMVLLGLLIIYGLKGMFLGILDFIFLARGHFVAYNTTVFIYNKMIGFILLPLVSIIPYVPSNITPWLFKAGVFVVFSLYTMRIFRGILVGVKIRLSFFYLILYLCALEILPVLMLYKIAKSFI